MQDKTIRIWNLKTTLCELTLTGHSDFVQCLRFMTLASKSYLLSGSRDKTIKVWDMRTGTCFRTLSGHTDYVNALEIINGTIVASGSTDTTVKVWDVYKDVCLQTIRGHSSWVLSLQFVGGQEFVSASDQTIKLWRLNASVPIKTLTNANFRAHSIFNFVSWYYGSQVLIKLY